MGKNTLALLVIKDEVEIRNGTAPSSLLECFQTLITSLYRDSFLVLRDIYDCSFSRKRHSFF